MNNDEKFELSLFYLLIFYFIQLDSRNYVLIKRRMSTLMMNLLK